MQTNTAGAENHTNCQGFSQQNKTGQIWIIIDLRTTGATDARNRLMEVCKNLSFNVKVFNFTSTTVRVPKYTVLFATSDRIIKTIYPKQFEAELSSTVPTVQVASKRPIKSNTKRWYDTAAKIGGLSPTILQSMLLIRRNQLTSPTNSKVCGMPYLDI